MNSYETEAERIAEEHASLDRLAPRGMFKNRIESVVFDGRFIHLKVEPTAAQRASYAIPGQYVIAQFSDGKPRFIALYGRPEDSSWELLFEPKPEWELDQFAPGLSIATSLAEGPGYPIAFNDFQRVTVFVGGSGIAGILPWLWSKPTVDDISIFFSLAEQAPATVSRTVLAAERLGAQLSVIDPSEMRSVADRFPVERDGNAVLLCGSPRMMKDVAEALIARGFDRDRIFTNL